MQTQKLSDNNGESNLSFRKIFLRFYPIFVLAAVVVFFGAITNGALFTVRNIKLIWEACFQLLLGCIGSIFLYAQGEQDFSMGSTIALASILFAYVSKVNLFLAFCVAILTGLLVGLFNGAIFAYFKIPAFFLTFCVANIISGFLPSLMKHQLTILASFSVLKFNNNYLKIGTLVVFFAIVWILYEKTMFGKVSRALGANQTVVMQSGLKQKKYKILAFVFTGFISGLIAFFAACKETGGSSTTGNLFQFNVLIAMTLGGAALGGARVKLYSAIVGPLIVAVLTIGMNLAGVGSAWQNIVKGVIFLLVLVANYRFGKLVVD